jgi:hypothetical protein
MIIFLLTLNWDSWGGQLGKMLLFDTRKFDIQTFLIQAMKHPVKLHATSSLKVI